MGDRDTHAQLAEAVGALPEHLREVLTLRIWGGLSFPEIGTVTGVSENTAASRRPKVAPGRLKAELRTRNGDATPASPRPALFRRGTISIRHEYLSRPAGQRVSL
jgi:hypothetical protein